MLRTLVINYNDDTPLHLISRPSQAWYQRCITVADPVETAEDLKRLAWNDQTLDYASTPGPLLRIVLSYVKDQGCAGLVCTAQQSAFDGISMSLFFEDLDALVSGKSVSSLPRRVPSRPGSIRSTT